MKFLIEDCDVVLNEAAVTAAIESVHIPPTEYFVRRAVPPHLLPTELVRCIASFMARADVDVSHLGTAECERIKEETLATLQLGTHEEAAAVVCGNDVPASHA
jgi:hypothetical protein